MDFPKLPDKLYNWLKWILLIVIPAAETLLTTLTILWGWNIPLEAIVGTMAAFATFFGAIIGLSSISYNKQKKGGA